MKKKRKLVIGGVYRHFKGYVMKVLCEAKDSETKNDVVVYIHLDDGRIWIRSKKMFLERITRGGKEFYRFELVKENG
ncbi:DUF1653 domain-containing protein [Patescibacteria group bacterium]|nr:DUF1653 domain-containing protein [Patescibacteria group bacterium]